MDLKTLKMNTKSLLLSLIAIFIALGTTANAQPKAYKYTSNHIVKRDTAMLAFRSGQDVLYSQYKDNAQELKNIMAFVSNHATTLRSGLSHINIVSYIKTNQVNNPIAVNAASIQGSIVRAQFKLKYNVPHTAITFSIDTAQNVTNLVRVDYVNNPVRKHNNTSIHYTLKRNNVQLASSEMAQYKPTVPYTNYMMRLVNENPATAFGEMATKEGDLIVINTYNNIQPQTDTEIIIATTIEEPQEPAQENLFIEPAAPVQPVTQETKPVETQTQPEESNAQNITTNIEYVKLREKNIVGIKTNLLQWATATPSLALEFYMGQNVSLEVHGSYTWAWFLKSTHQAYYKWDTGGEIKYWLKPGKFNGHAIGVHATTGEYDMKFKTDGIGKQGNYWAVGLTYNYMLPIGEYFNMEFSLGAGYAQYDVLKYKYQPENNINKEVERNNGKSYFGPTKAKIALVWKF